MAAACMPRKGAVEERQAGRLPPQQKENRPSDSTAQPLNWLATKLRAAVFNRPDETTGGTFHHGEESYFDNCDDDVRIWICSDVKSRH